jgi:hypothetical protein
VIYYRGIFRACDDGMRQRAEMEKKESDKGWYVYLPQPSCHVLLPLFVLAYKYIANATLSPTSPTCPTKLSSPYLSPPLQATLDEKAAMMQDNLGQEPFTDPDANPSDMVALLSTVNEGMVMMEEQAEDYNRSSQLVRKFESNKKSVENARVLLDQKVKHATIESRACTDCTCVECTCVEAMQRAERVAFAWRARCLSRCGVSGGCRSW